MPVLRFKPGRVEEVLRLPLMEAVRVVERLKIEVEILDDGTLEFEVEVDRPDMYSLEGIARQVDGLLGRAAGMPAYETVDSGVEVVARQVPSRPYIAAAVVWDVNVDEDFLVELIQFQEKLHTSLGRGRSRVAIGIHDFEKLPGRTVTYSEEDVDSVVFTPLGGSKPMTLREVLDSTEQGRKYGGLSLRENRLHPVLRADGEVISVPPVINAETTRVEPGTRHIFIDVTGTELKPVLDTLSILAANLAERSSSRRIGLVRVKGPWGVLVEPSMKPYTINVDAGYVSRVIGVDLDAKSLTRHLRRMRFDAAAAGEEDRLLEVLVPRYRVDILHPVDVAEEVALSIGLDNLAPKKPRLMLRGGLLSVRSWEREARKIMVGMGFVEVISYSLVPCSYARLAGVPEEVVVRIENPVGVDSECLRPSLLPGMLELLPQNKHNMPVKVFELGKAALVTRSGDVGVEMRRLLAAVISGDKAGYEDIQAVAYTLLRLLGDEVVEVRRTVHPLLIEGRAAEIRTRMGVKGLLGEVKPQHLEALGAEHPAAVMELDYTGLAVPRP